MGHSHNSNFEQSSHDPPNLADATSEPAKNEPMNNFKQFSLATRFAQDTGPSSSQRLLCAAASSGSAIFIFPTSTEFQRCRPFHSPMKVTTSTPKCVLTVRGRQSQLHFFSVHLIFLSHAFFSFSLPFALFILFLSTIFSCSLSMWTKCPNYYQAKKPHHQMRQYLKRK